MEETPTTKETVIVGPTSSLTNSVLNSMPSKEQLGNATSYFLDSLKSSKDKAISTSIYVKDTVRDSMPSKEQIVNTAQQVKDSATNSLPTREQVISATSQMKDSVINSMPSREQLKDSLISSKDKAVNASIYVKDTVRDSMPSIEQIVGSTSQMKDSVINSMPTKEQLINSKDKAIGATIYVKDTVRDSMPSKEQIVNTAYQVKDSATKLASTTKQLMDEHPEVTTAVKYAGMAVVMYALPNSFGVTPIDLRPLLLRFLPPDVARIVNRSLVATLRTYGVKNIQWVTKAITVPLLVGAGKHIVPVFKNMHSTTTHSNTNYLIWPSSKHQQK